MSTYEIHTLDDLEMNIRACGQKQFTGRLDLEIQDFAGSQWSLFFDKGGLVGGSSEMHSVRRWCRQLVQHCPHLMGSSQPGSDRIQRTLYQRARYIDQSALMRLTQQGKVSQEQMASVVAGNLREILFDLMQLSHQRCDRLAAQLTYNQLPPALTASTAHLIPVDYVWHQALQTWTMWQRSGLENWSPSWAPVIWDTEELRRQTSLLVYHNLTTWINGDRTLRDLAVELKQPLVALTQSLIPYIRKGIIGLIEVRDWQPDSTFKTGSFKTGSFKTGSFSDYRTAPVSKVRSSSPLVAYIEDSRFDCIAMSQILARAGCRFVNIQDPVQALPILMEQKPDMIFLDLLMPVTNGYEVCSQIRRISAFQQTPIIIVTSSDGIVDRVRAKLVGSSGFVSKPIEPDKIMPVLRDCLPSPSESNVDLNS